MGVNVGRRLTGIAEELALAYQILHSLTRIKANESTPTYECGHGMDQFARSVPAWAQPASMQFKREHTWRVV